MQAVVDHLKALSLAVESSGGRVMRYAHNVGKSANVPSQSVAMLAVLMLRGPQTTGELRINCERLHHFSDISAVEGFLNELAARDAGALVVELPRQPGTRETRWAHLLAGPPAPETAAALPPPTARSSPCPNWPRCAPMSRNCKGKSTRSRPRWRSSAPNWASGPEAPRLARRLAEHIAARGVELPGRSST